MLSDADWTRLIAGLIDATAEERLEWRGEAANSFGPFAALSAAATYSKLISGRRIRLTADTAHSIFEVSASEGGLAPYALKVWEKKGFNPKEVGSIESSTNPLAMRSGLNDALGALWSVASATVESGDVIVDRLLEDLEG